MTKGRTQNLEGPIDVAICVPTTGAIKTATVNCLMGAWGSFANWEPSPGITKKTARFYTQSISCLPQARHNLVKRALKTGCTHVLFIDSDMVFPLDIIQRMLVRNKGVLGVNCTNRGFPVKPIAQSLKWEDLDSRKKYGVQKVQQVGTGIMMVKAEVLKKLQPPLFMFEWIPMEQKYSGEDIYFCAKLDEIGEEVWVDHDVSHETGHVGDTTFGPGWIDVEMPDYRWKRP